MKTYQYLLGIVLLVGVVPAHAADEVVANVNGATIRNSDLEAAVDQLIPRATYHGAVSEARRDEFRQKALTALIDQELEYQDAVAAGMKPDRNSVKSQMERIRGQFNSKKMYKQALERAHITEDELQARIERNDVVQSAIAKNVTEPSRMSDQDFKAYYEKNPDKFKQPEQVKLKLISMRAESKAKDALERIKRGDDFSDVAAAMSEDDYRVKGGDIGYIHRGRVLQELEDVAFNLKIGETSGLIKAEDHWYIIRVDDKLPEHVLGFDEAREKRKGDLEKQRAKELMDAWLTRLKAKAKIEVVWKPAVSGDVSDKPATIPGH